MSLTTRILSAALLGAALLPGSAVLAQGTLERVAERGEFRIGYRTDAMPLSFEEGGRAVGYSIDICSRIALALREKLSLPDMRVSYVPVTLANRFDMLVDGNIDIECGSSTVTLGRQERVDFTLTTFVTGGSLLSMQDSRVGTLPDLAGKRVAVLSDTTTETALEQQLRERRIDARVVTVASSGEAIARLVDGRVDAFASDQIVLLGDALRAMDGNPDLNFSFSNELFSYEPYALMVRRNDADFRLVANRAIAELFRSGDYAPIFETWIGSNGIAPPTLLLAMYQLNALRE